MTTIMEFLQDVPDRAGSFSHTPVSLNRYAHFLFVLNQDIDEALAVLRDHKVGLDLAAHPTEGWWEELA
jgi:hypothetical protein